MTEDINIVDTFAGPGGWDEGLRLLGRSDVVGLEWDAAACATAKAAGHARIRTDVATYPTEAFGEVEGFISSPPCQDFSSAGLRAGVEGKKGHLVSEVLRWVGDLRPRWVACEQVPEVLPIWQHYAEQMRHMGYSAWTGVLEAANYGVPQTRERAILLARRDGVPAVPPTPTHARVREPETMFGPGRSAWRTLQEATGRGAGWELHHIRGAGMTERHGKRPGRRVDEPGFTVLAWKDSRMRWEREGETERFTLADALAVQTFPPGYPVEGSSTKAHEQIGNAIPPLFAAHILAALGVGELAVDVAEAVA